MSGYLPARSLRYVRSDLVPVVLVYLGEGNPYPVLIHPYFKKVQLEPLAPDNGGDNGDDANERLVMIRRLIDLKLESGADRQPPLGLKHQTSGADVMGNDLSRAPVNLVRNKDVVVQPVTPPPFGTQPPSFISRHPTSHPTPSFYPLRVGKNEITMILASDVLTLAIL